MIRMPDMAGQYASLLREHGPNLLEQRKLALLGRLQIRTLAVFVPATHYAQSRVRAAGLQHDPFGRFEMRPKLCRRRDRTIMKRVCAPAPGSLVPPCRHRRYDR